MQGSEVGMNIGDACKIVGEIKDRVWCGTDDLDTTIRISREKEALETMLKYCVDTIALYENWARENNKHVCVTCGRQADNVCYGTRCPIQEHYGLPKDGFCHLWEERR